MDIQFKKGKHRFSNSFYNSVTYFGVALSVLVLICEFYLFGLDILAPSSSAYLGIFTYILLPPFLILGLILIPLGARWKQKRVLKGLAQDKPRPIYIDPSLATHQNAILIFLIGTAIVLIMTAIGCYKAFHFTESVRFCGAVCHKIMGPEYIAYTGSPHARVKCVECHIGSGVGWYVHYKLAGVNMLMKTLKNSYERPVPSPMNTLRPAKETCKECHWPGKSFSSIELNRTYFSDEGGKTSRWNIRMLMHVGGQKNNTGIHAHMYSDNDIYYASEDNNHQKITWFKTVDKQGHEKIFTTKDSPYKDVLPPNNIVRQMDCMDCHNRPAHRFEAPTVAVNRAMVAKKIDPGIPMIKTKALDVLSKNYKSEKEALLQIRSALRDYYAKSQAQYYAEHSKEVAQAIDTIAQIYQMNLFPEMKTRWDSHPDNIGHLTSLGCFRCHDEEHTTKSGEKISRDCAICHTIISQGQPDALESNIEGVEFKHPFDNDDSWKTMNCSDCHTGGS